MRGLGWGKNKTPDKIYYVTEVVFELTFYKL